MRYGDEVKTATNPPVCFNCDKPAAAVWHGVHGVGSHVEVCSDCAINILPRLIADAVPVKSVRQAASYWEMAKLPYLEALITRAFSLGGGT